MAVQVLTYDGLKHTVNLIQNRIDGVVCDMASSATTLTDSLKELSCRVDELERAFSEVAANIAELKRGTLGRTSPLYAEPLVLVVDFHYFTGDSAAADIHSF